jgi:hypothetical protein
MIFTDTTIGTENEFQLLLLNSKKLVLEKLETIQKPSLLSGTEFENISLSATQDSSKGTIFENHIYQTADRDFPDIVANNYWGIEVKATKKDDWRSIGNSVLESSRIPTVEKIYIFFGKLGGIPDVNYRQYEQCLSGVSVTHYPRYQIDMKLNEGQSIFDKMQVPYDIMRNGDNPVKHVREYYKSKLKPGEDLWWIADDVETPLSPILKPFRMLEQDLQRQYLSEIFILFPEIYTNSSTKFERAAAYLITHHNVFSSNIRDHFTAGGRTTIETKRGLLEVPRITATFKELIPQIEKSLNTLSENTISFYWENKMVRSEIKSLWLGKISAIPVEDMSGVSYFDII